MAIMGHANRNWNQQKWKSDFVFLEKETIFLKLFNIKHNKTI